MPNLETGTKSHFDRMGLTNRLCEMLDYFFKEHDFDHMEGGQSHFFRDNPSLNARFRKLDVKRSEVALMVKFYPDYLVHHKATQKFFLLDAKTSITPRFFGKPLEELRQKSGRLDLDRHRVAEIEREAWDNYNNRFPERKVAICFACPYNPELVLTEWATNLVEIDRFEQDTNEDAGGSHTPHVNIDLRDMRNMKTFFEDEFDIEIDEDIYESILEMVKEWPLNKPGRVNWTQFNNVILTLHKECPWLEGRIPKIHKALGKFDNLFKMHGVNLETFSVSEKSR